MDAFKRDPRFNEIGKRISLAFRRLQGHPRPASADVGLHLLNWLGGAGKM